MTTPTKRPKHHHHHHHDHSLLPGLPNDVAELCLALAPPSTLSAVCHAWRRLIYSPSFPPFLSLYALLADPGLSAPLRFASYDPISRAWRHLPPPPPPLNNHLLFRHPSFISRKLPIQSVAVNGKLVLLAATADHFLPALSEPLVFSPRSRKWTKGPPLAAPRRWCVAGAARGAVYVASGIGSHYDNEVARSVEKWDVENNQRWRWEKKARLKDSKFSREAIEAVGWRGKLCMVNVKGDAWKEGIIYDVERDAWTEMPEGMLMGWRGPAAAMAEETIYVVDESRGWLKRYDDARDAWVEVLEDERLKGAQQVVAEKGRVCVLCGDGERIVVVDVAAPAPEKRVWMVEVPTGFQAVGIHVLPRLSCEDEDDVQFQ